MTIVVTPAVSSTRQSMRDFVDARQMPAGASATRPLHRPPHHQHADHAAGEREQDALSQQLPRDARASGAEGGACRQLFLARDAARQQQVGDVDRRHHQHEARCRRAGSSAPGGWCRPTDRSSARPLRSSPCWSPDTPVRAARRSSSCRLRPAAATTPAFSRPIAPHQCTLRTTWPCALSMRLFAAIGPEKAIGSQHVDAGDAREAARAEHAGIREDEIRRHHADHLERLTPFSVSDLPTMDGSAPQRRRQ